MTRKLKEGNIISRLIFGYAYKIIKKGNKKNFEISDLYELEEDQHYQSIHRNYTNYIKSSSKDRSLLFRMTGFIKRNLAQSITFDLISKMLLLLIPFLLKAIIHQLEYSDQHSPSICIFQLICIFLRFLTCRRVLDLRFDLYYVFAHYAQNAVLQPPRKTQRRGQCLRQNGNLLSHFREN